MSERRAALVAGALAALALLLVLVNIGLELADDGVQAEVNQRQAFIAQTAEVSNVDNALIRALATAAASKKDSRIDEVLKQAGVTYTLTPAAPAAAAPTPPAEAAPAATPKP